jgi:hypothetical protein
MSRRKSISACQDRPRCLFGKHFFAPSRMQASPYLADPFMSIRRKTAMTLETLPGAAARPSTDDLERIEIDAWRDYCAAAPPAFAQAVGLETAEFDGPLLAMCRRIDHYQFNRLMGGGLAGDADGGSLAIAV